MPDYAADRWPRVERLYLEALEQDPPAREAFLEAASAGDDELCREVRSLLRYESAAEHFLGHPALVAAARDLARAVPSLTGRHISGYEVVALIGAGGMGDVYRARDLRLERDVALKVLDPLAAFDPEYRRRFEDEAKSASGLNHPNIVTIYGVGEEGGATFIAMELVHGLTLREHLSVGAMPIRSALDIAVQLTSALAAAHVVGIVHRDLKPENVMVTPEGLVKVLDFGIAKRLFPHVVSDDDAGAPTIRTGETEGSTIVGTVGYMSPEQAVGLPAGPASDQFSLGAILYEMVAGRRAFHRDSRVETVRAIVDAVPEPVHHLTRTVPPALRHAIERCLAKDPADRFVDARDLDRALRQIRDGLSAGVTRREWLSLGAAGVLALTGVTTWALWPFPSLAVLPFVNAAKDDAVDYLCLGLTESLIGRIKHLPLAVKSLSLVSNFVGSSADSREIGRQLGVGKVVAGEVKINAGQLLVTAELIDRASGVSLWKNHFEGATVDIFKLWDEIATAVVDDGLHLRLTREERRELLSRPTDNAEAYDLFLRARPFQMSNTEGDYLTARALLQQAVDKDPRFAEAWVALGGTYWTSVLENYLPPSEAWPQVSRCLTRASALNPRLSDLHIGRAIASFFASWNWAAAEREWQQAWAAPDRDLQPEHLISYALARWAFNDARGALRIVHRARTLDPLSPILILEEASFLLRTNQFEEAAARCRSVIQTHPEMATPYFSLAEIRRAQQRFEEAIEALRRGHMLRGDSDEELEAVLADAKGREGYGRVEATAVRRLELRTLERRARRAYASPLDFARAYAQLDDRDRAIDYLREALEARTPGLVFLNVDRAWDPIRTDPAFRAAVKRVGLPLYN
jgi:serine/threonine protein kinase/tetratricopeptide (TPR) repeat protein